MEMLIFMLGVLLCLVLSVAITLYAVKYANRYQPLLTVVVMLTTMATLTTLYNTVVQEYLIGKQVTYEQVRSEASVVTLYFK